MDKYDSVIKFVNRVDSGTLFVQYVVCSVENRMGLIEEIKKCNVDGIRVRFNVWSMVLGVYSIDSGIEHKI